MAASKESLEALHSAVANKLTETIEAMETDTKGLAAILNVARQFCKDNGIEAVPAPGSSMGKLADKMKEYPFDPASDGVH